MGGLAGQLGHIVGNAVFVGEEGLLKAPLPLVPKAEDHPRVHHRLAVEDVGEVVCGDVRLGEDLQVGQPGDGGARLLPVGGGDLHLSHQASLFKMQVIPLAVPADHHVHKPGGILGGAGAQAIQAQGVFIVVPGGVVILAPGVELTEHQLPVVFSHLFVPVHRAAPAKVLHLNPAVPEPGEDDLLAVALPGLVDGVGEDLEHRVLAALQPVRAEAASAPGRPPPAWRWIRCHIPVCSLPWKFSLSYENGPMGPRSSYNTLYLNPFFRGMSRGILAGPGGRKAASLLGGWLG